MVADEPDDERFFFIAKNQTQLESRPALKCFLVQFTDAKPRVPMRLAKAFRQLQQGEQSINAFELWQRDELLLEWWGENQRLVQAFSSVRNLVLAPVSPRAAI